MDVSNAPEQAENDIKINISNEEVEKIIEKYYGLKGGHMTQLLGYDDLNFKYSPKDNKNPFIKLMWPHGYVVKIMNSSDSKLKNLCEAQNNIMVFLRENNIAAPIPIKSLSGQHYIKIKIPVKASANQFYKQHIVRILEFQPGVVLKEITKSYSTFYKLGIFIGHLNKVLKKFFDPFYNSHDSIWHLHNMPKIKLHLQVLENVNQRSLVENIVQEFVQQVLSKKVTFEKGIIHGDLNENNILMSKSEQGEWEVSAVLDFGDSHFSNYFFEVAISLCYAMLECKKANLDFLTGAGHVLAGYLNIHPTFVINYKLMKICICARLSQSLVLGLKTYSVNPKNTYVLESQYAGWPLLEKLWEIPVDDIARIWDVVIQSYGKI